MSDATRDFFDTLSKVLLRCWLYGFLLLLFWFALYMAASGTIYRLHGTIFGLSMHEMDLMMYCWMGFFKLWLILFFFFPWLAIRMVLKKSNAK